MAHTGKVALVTGITGTVGDRAAVRLLEAGVRVRGLIRSPEQAERLVALGVEPVVGDLSDAPSLAAAADGAHLVIHSAAYLGADPELSRAANVEGTAALAEAALAAGVERFVQISTLSVYGMPSSGVIDESYPLVTEHRIAYCATKAEAERRALAVADRGLPLVVLRPGAICSERNSHWGDRLVQRLAEKGVPQGMHPGTIIPWVHTENFVEMVYLAATRPEAVGQVYNAIDGNYTYEEFLGPVLRALGHSFPAPDKEPMAATYAHAKIAELGYRPVRSFTETVRALERQAKELAVRS